MTLREFGRLCIFLIGVGLTFHVVVLLGAIGHQQWNDREYGVSVFSYVIAWTALSVGLAVSVIAARHLIPRPIKRQEAKGSEQTL